MAHDLNNILAPILGFSQILPLKLPNVDEGTKEYFQIINTNAKRGSALVKQILTFSRGLEGDRGIVQIRHLIAEIKQISRWTSFFRNRSPAQKLSLEVKFLVLIF